jgi:hypothetical protein
LEQTPSEALRDKVWAYIAKNYPEHRIAWKGIGHSPWKYALIKDYAATRFTPGSFNHRDVLPEELVMDFDGERPANDSRDVANRMSDQGYTYALWATNVDMTGFHLQSLWEIPLTVSDVPLLKRCLCEYLAEVDLNDQDKERRKGIDTQLLGKHLVRFEGGTYEKKQNKGSKTLIEEHGDFFHKNKLPDIVWKRYTSLILKERLRVLRRGSSVPHQKDTPASIRFLLSPKFKEYRDGGKRALFVLASYYRALPDDKLYSLLHDFNRYNLKTPLDEKSIQATVKSVRNHKGRTVGEAYCKELLRSIGAYKEVYGE